MRNEQLANHKTRSMSFRIPEEMADSLETEASMKRISPSNLLVQILSFHNDYLENASRAGLVAFPRPLLVRLMEKLPEKQVVALAEYISRDTITDIMAVLQPDYNVETFLRVIESWARASMMPFRRETRGNLNTIILQHDLSMNWSLYLGNLYKCVIEDLVEKSIKVETTPNTTLIRF